MEKVLPRAGLILAAGAVGALCAYWVHYGCFNAPAAIGGVESGTPRAHLCGAVQAYDPWLLFVALPAAIIATLSIRLPLRVLVAVTGLMILAMLVVSLLTNTLEYSTPGL